MAEIEEKQTVGGGFKMPQLPGMMPAPPEPKDPVPKELKKPEPVIEEQPPPKKSVPMKSPAELLKERSEPPLALQYTEPEWAGMPPAEDPYFVEELKSGQIVNTYKLKSKSVFLIGRLPSCDIQLEHPSLSRHHAILQYKKEGSADQPEGFYLYDLGSTHGSFHNKNRCFPKTYYRLRVGHMLKFGGSTRMLIVQGPDTDAEDESDLTVTELREKSAEKARKKAEEKRLEKEAADEEERKKREEEEARGIGWGMAEDAVEDESNPDMALNPFSMGDSGATPNESKYIDDPKKTLRGWFEREGFELDYKCEERGYATFHCTVDLPINQILDSGTGGPVIAEATVKGGKKKEAVVQCALEACRILDRYNLLRQSNQESRVKKQVKKWKEDDYYDSDEDEFLDRTGTIASKRLKRMQMEGEVTENKSVDTFETLTAKEADMVKTVAATEKKLKDAIAALAEAKKLDEAGDEDLDAYMAQLKKAEKGQGGKEAVSKLRQTLAGQQQELSRLRKLVEIARPTQMPKLQASSTKSAKSVMIGKRWGFGSAKNLRTVLQKQAATPQSPQAKDVPEITETVADKKSESDSGKIEGMEATNVINRSTAEELQKQQQSESVHEVGMKGPTLPPPTSDESKSKDKHDNDNNDEPVAKKKKKKHHRNKQRDKDDNLAESDEKQKVPGDYESADRDPKFATWLPPANQTGDGRTSLNDKYGY